MIVPQSAAMETTKKARVSRPTQQKWSMVNGRWGMADGQWSMADGGTGSEFQAQGGNNRLQQP
jgi:hypothetical protein